MELRFNTFYVDVCAVTVFSLQDAIFQLFKRLRVGSAARAPRWSSWSNNRHLFLRLLYSEQCVHWCNPRLDTLFPNYQERCNCRLGALRGVGFRCTVAACVCEVLLVELCSCWHNCSRTCIMATALKRSRNISPISSSPRYVPAGFAVCCR